MIATGAIVRRSPNPRGSNALNRSTVAPVAFFISLACILGATLTPAGTEFQPDFVSCLICGSRAWADAIANLLLYAPLGAALVWNGRIGLKPVFAAFLLSACIELAQTVIPGRDPSLSDVTFNTLGAAAGQLGALLARRWLVPEPSIAARLSLAAATLAGAIFAFTGRLLAPAIPTTALTLWYAPDLPELPWFHARVLETRIGTIPLRPGRLTDSTAVRQLLLTGAPLAITALAGPPVPSLGPLIAFEDDDADQIYLIGPDRHDLVIRLLTRGATWGLDQPDIRLRGAFASVARGDSMRIGIRGHGAGYCLSLNATERCGLGYSIGTAWAMVLYPRHWPPWAYALLGSLWVGGLALPVGVWTRRRALSFLAIALFAGAALLVPGAVGLLPTSLLEWSGAIIGWGAGVALQALLRRGAGARASAMGS